MAHPITPPPMIRTSVAVSLCLLSDITVLLLQEAVRPTAGPFHGEHTWPPTADTMTRSETDHFEIGLPEEPTRLAALFRCWLQGCVPRGGSALLQATSAFASAAGLLQDGFGWHPEETALLGIAGSGSVPQRDPEKD